MILGKHITNNEELRSLANARDIGAARDLLNVIEIERDSLRKNIETTPEGHFVNTKLAKISALNWVLDLPRKAKKLIDNLPEGE